MKNNLTCVLLLFLSQIVLAQTDSTSADTKKQETTDTLSKFDRFNQKGEALFKYIPVPIYSHTLESGDIFGLAKFNLIDLYKNDTITRPSKISGVATTSTKGRVNISIGTEFLLKDNKYIFLSYMNYRKTPEYVLGIGNDVKIEDKESISNTRVRFNTVALRKINKDFYVGPGIDISYYYNMVVDSNSIMKQEHADGLTGGLNVGLGICGAYDTRDNRYNSRKGSYILLTTTFYGDALGSDYSFNKANLDARKFFNPWFKHIIALQVTTNYSSGTVPYYNLALLGGDAQMRGYYEGAIRDKVLIDGQLEYRMPIWNIFGVAGWVGTGRVAPTYSQMELRNLWLSYGLGARIRVDTEHDTNLRIDFGFGPHGVNAFIIGFAEAF